MSGISNTGDLKGIFERELRSRLEKKAFESPKGKIGSKAVTPYTGLSIQAKKTCAIAAGVALAALTIGGIVCTGFFGGKSGFLVALLSGGSGFFGVAVGSALVWLYFEINKLKDPEEREKVKEKLCNGKLSLRQRLTIVGRLDMDDAYQYGLFETQEKIESLFQLHRLGRYDRTVGEELFGCFSAQKQFYDAVCAVSEPLFQALSGESVVTAQPSVMAAPDVPKGEESTVKSVNEALDWVDDRLAYCTRDKPSPA